MGAGTGALFKGASKFLPKVLNKSIKTPAVVDELGELATNPQAYVAKTGRPVGLSRLPKENIQEVAPTVTTTPTGETQLNVGLQAVEQNALKEEPVKEGFVRLYRGLTNEFDPKYNKSKLDNINGYESWTDNYDLAKAYGDKVYHIDVPKSKIASDIIDENPKSMTYGDRNLLYKHDKPVGIKGESGNEYMLYTPHDDYGTLKYNKVNQPQVNVPKMVQPEIPTTTKQTKLSESIQEAKGLPTDIKKTIKQNAPTYESMTNNDLIMTASDAIDKDLMGNLSDIMAKDKFNAFDVERTRQIAKRLNAQNTPEANETLINLLDKASEQASKSGQAVQAFSLWNNLTPEGAILKTNKLLNEYNKRFGKNLKLTQEQINNITKLQETAQALPDGYNKDVALAKSLKYQQGLIPKALGSKNKNI